MTFERYSSDTDEYFNNCSGDIIIPSTVNYGDTMYAVTEIGEMAFYDCTGLTRFYSASSVPPVCGSKALADIDKEHCTLYVPEDAVDAYSAADQWKDFFFIEGHDFSKDE